MVAANANHFARHVGKHFLLSINAAVFVIQRTVIAKNDGYVVFSGFVSDELAEEIVVVSVLVSCNKDFSHSSSSFSR